MPPADNLAHQTAAGAERSDQGDFERRDSAVSKLTSERHRSADFTHILPHRGARVNPPDAAPTLAYDYHVARATVVSLDHV